MRSVLGCEAQADSVTAILSRNDDRLQLRNVLNCLHFPSPSQAVCVAWKLAPRVLGSPLSDLTGP